MHNLKTLKDFETYHGGISAEELRAEAIKWIKAINYESNWVSEEGSPYSHFRTLESFDDGDYSQYDGVGAVKLLEDFFNITKEDLE